MADDQNNQRDDKDQEVRKKAQAKETKTFGERIENTKENTSANQELTDEYGELIYRDHDEFGEWLDRHN